VPVQYREVEGYESPEFLSIFPDGIVCMKGGVESGFNKVKPEAYQPRLLHVKGKGKNVAVTEVPLNAKSVNDGDAFVLDLGLTILVWQGTGAGAFEKAKASKAANIIESERSGKAKVETLQSGAGDAAFWKPLGGKPASIPKEGGKDDVVKPGEKRLFRISDGTGTLTFKEVKKGAISAKDFDSKDAFVFDAGTQIFVWVGQGASPAEKKEGLGLALKYLADSKKPGQTPIARVSDGHESNAFKQYLSK
jgi:hypothetical protein